MSWWANAVAFDIFAHYLCIVMVFNWFPNCFSPVVSQFFVTEFQIALCKTYTPKIQITVLPNCHAMQRPFSQSQKITLLIYVIEKEKNANNNNNNRTNHRQALDLPSMKCCANIVWRTWNDPKIRVLRESQHISQFIYLFQRFWLIFEFISRWQIWFCESFIFAKFGKFFNCLLINRLF